MAPPPLEPLTMNNLPETIRTELLQVLNNLYYDVQIYLVAVVMTTIIDTHYHEY